MDGRGRARRSRGGAGTMLACAAAIGGAVLVSGLGGCATYSGERSQFESTRFTVHAAEGGGGRVGSMARAGE